MDPINTADATGKDSKKKQDVATPPAAVPEVQKKKRQWKPRDKAQGATTITGRIDLYDKRGNHCLFFVEMQDSAEGQSVFADQAMTAAFSLKLKIATLEHGLAIIK